LAIPVVLTLFAAIVTWLRGRPARPLDTDESMRAHGDYLDALAQTARAKDRGPLAQPRD
jgi:Ser/Thr protein kinase RdoA (MazF antagonist)